MAGLTLVWGNGSAQFSGFSDAINCGTVRFNLRSSTSIRAKKDKSGNQEIEKCFENA
jgi:hypothetical protein